MQVCTTSHAVTGKVTSDFRMPLKGLHITFPPCIVPAALGAETLAERHTVQ
jgi:hypothetical protein